MGSDKAGYDAFLSYSHEHDAQFARLLQRRLERMGTSMPWQRRLRVFRDETNLAARPDLWGAIASAIDQSTSLILLASPTSAQSGWVDKEIRYFLEKNEVSKLVIVLTDGDTPWTSQADPSEPMRPALSPALLAIFEERQWEPLVVDFRALEPHAGRRLARNPQFLTRVASISAAIQDRDRDEIYGEHLRAQRVAVMGMAIVLLLVSVLAVVAVVQKTAADQARALAERRLDGALSVAHHINFVLEEELRVLGGAASIRSDLLNASGVLLDQLLGEATENAEGLYQRMVSHVYRADIALEHENVDTAQEEVEAAVSIGSRLVHNDPDNLKWQQALSVGLNRLGEVYVQRGEPGSAFEQFRRAHEIRQALAEKEPEVIRRYLDLAVSVILLSDMLMEIGRDDEAEEKYRNTQSALEDLITEVPDSLELQRNLLTVTDKLGDRHFRRGEHDRALKEYRKSESLLRTLLKAQPTHTGLRRSLAGSLIRLGDVEFEREAYEGALISYREAKNMANDLVEQEPDNSDWLRIQSVCIDKEADTLLASGQSEAAYEGYQHSLAIARGLVESDPNSASWQDNLAGSLDRIGSMYAARGETDAALTLYTEGLEIRAGLVDRTETPDALAALANAYRRLGEILEEDYQLQDAREAFDEAVKIYDRALQIDADDAERRHDLSNTLNQLGQVAFKQQDFDVAERAYQRAEAVLTDLLREDPTNSQLHRDRAWSLDYLGSLASARDDLATALAQFEAASAIRAILAKERPNDQQRQFDLSVSFNTIGRVHVTRGDLDSALAKFRGSHAIRSHLLAQTPDNDEWRLALARSKDARGEVLLAKARLDEAERLFVDARQLRSEVLARSGTTAVCVHGLAMSSVHLAEIATARDRHADVIKHTTEALIHFARVFAMEPKNADYQADLKWMQERLFELLRERPMSRIRETVQLLETQAQSLDESLSLAASETFRMAAAVALDLLHEPSLALRFSSAVLSYHPVPRAAEVCPHAEMSLAAGSAVSQALKYAQQCVAVSELAEDRIAGYAFQFAAWILADELAKARTISKHLNTAMAELGTASLSWQFVGLKKALEQFKHPESQKLITVFDALELPEPPERQKKTMEALRLVTGS